MKRLTDTQLEQAIKYRPYVRKRARLEMGPFNLLFVILTFVGGSIAYEPDTAPRVITAAGGAVVRAEANGSLPPATDEELLAALDRASK